MKKAKHQTPLFAVCISLVLTLNVVFGNNLENKAKDVVMPTFELENATPADALRTISQASHIKILYTPRATDVGCVTLSLTNVPADTAIRYVAALSNLKYTYMPDAVQLAPE